MIIQTTSYARCKMPALGRRPRSISPDERIALEVSFADVRTLEDPAWVYLRHISLTCNPASLARWPARAERSLPTERQSFANAELSGRCFWRGLLHPHGQRSAVSVPMFFSFPEIQQSRCQAITDTWSVLVNILTADAALLEECIDVPRGRLVVFLYPVGHDPPRALPITKFPRLQVLRV